MNLPRAFATRFEDANYRSRGGEIREQTRPAKRASGVGEKPRVNTVQVEGVAAFGEQSEVIFGLELAQTYGAIEGVLDADDGLVVENREGVDVRLVNTGVMEVEELLQLALEGGGVIVRLIWVSVVWSEKKPDEEVE